MLIAHGVPEWAADCTCIGPAVEDGANDFGLACPCVTVFAEVGVEAQRSVMFPLNQSLALQKINREDRRMAAVAAAERQGAVLQIGKRSDRPTGDRNDLGHPADIGIAHRDRSAMVVAPGIGLEVCEVRIPCDVDARQRLAWQGKEGGDLCLVALKQHDLDGKMRFLVKIPSHTLPDADHLWIVSHGTYPDRPTHGCFSPRALMFRCDQSRTERCRAGSAPAFKTVVIPRRLCR